MQWRDGKRHGPGRLTMRDGQVVEGEWVEDELSGRVSAGGKPTAPPSEGRGGRGDEGGRRREERGERVEERGRREESGGRWEDMGGRGGERAGKWDERGGREEERWRRIPGRERYPPSPTSAVQGEWDSPGEERGDRRGVRRASGRREGGWEEMEHVKESQKMLWQLNVDLQHENERLVTSHHLLTTLSILFTRLPPLQIPLPSPQPSSLALRPIFSHPSPLPSPPPTLPLCVRCR